MRKAFQDFAAVTAEVVGHAVEYRFLRNRQGGDIKGGLLGDGVNPPAGYENKTKCGRKIPEKSLSDNILPYTFAKVKTFAKNNYI